MIWKVVAVDLLIIVLSTAHAGELFVVDNFRRRCTWAYWCFVKRASILEDMDKNGVSKQIVMARAYPGRRL